MLTMLILILKSMVATHAPETVRTTVADGSVWADSWRGGTLQASQRLRDPRAREHWLAVDVNGDGRLDLVAVAIDAGAPRLELWLAGPDGFVRAGS